METITGPVFDIAQKARQAAFLLQQVPSGNLTACLNDLADRLSEKSAGILQANQKDISKAEQNALSPAMMDRLRLDKKRIESMASGVRVIADLEDPCGKILEEWVRPNGLRIQKISVPIGVIGMIYESRPNVTVDAAALCLKSRNAVILRGGSDSVETSRFLHSLIEESLKTCGLPVYSVAMIPDQDRARVGEMLGAAGLIDVMIPRGGKGLTSRVMAEARMPVFAHLDGNCHIYIHPSADPLKAIDVIKNAKLRRTGICGALESLLLDSGLEKGHVKDILTMLLNEGVEVRGDAKTRAFDDRIVPATEEDWATEYLDKIISCKFVNGVSEAVAHINQYGSHHTDSILAQDKEALAYFQQNVDSAIVMQNASTQFADGGEFGFGGEIGIGTGKLHARGPVGVRELCTFKYIVTGDGQTRP